MASSSFTLIVDDQDPQIQYNCPVIKEHVKGSYLRNTWTSIDSLSCGQQSGWFTHVFNGTQTRIWASASQLNQNYSVKIDGGPFIGQSGDGYYESPILEDGQHTVTYAAGAQSLFPAFDYLTVTAGLTTQLLGRTVIVDDAEITGYSGQWSTQSPSPLTLGRPSAIYKNTTHWTQTVGDTFTFQFNGNSISVHGVVPNNTNSGANSTATYIIDGLSTVVPFPSSNLVQPMAELFHADLEAGTHTLVFNMTDVAPSHAFGIDFVLYNSSAETLPAGSTDQAPGASPPRHTNSNRTGVIIGATLGTVAALVVLGLVFFLFRRSRARAKSESSSDWDVVSKANQ
ncbi:hypothetical protein DFH06DRAFT_1435296 [Mycena polygramma]|nr:hypothetical protein DFH06DRAFT_1435296 [Mycena polygramma]